MLTFTASAVTVAAPMLWYAVWTWRGPGGAAALADERSGATALSVIAVVLWGFRWLACLVTSLLTGAAVGYLLDLLLSQRGGGRRLRALTGPLEQARDR